MDDVRRNIDLVIGHFLAFVNDKDLDAIDRNMSVAQGDKVVVRNVWEGTRIGTQQRIEFHGFVLWRVAGGKIAERWATVTPLHELAAERLDW